MPVAVFRDQQWISEKKMSDNRESIQKVWAILLILAGVGVFIRIPQVLPKIEAIRQFENSIGVIKFCFYFIGVFLVGGGIKKLYHLYKDHGSRTED